MYFRFFLKQLESDISINNFVFHLRHLFSLPGRMRFVNEKSHLIDDVAGSGEGPKSS